MSREQFPHYIEFRQVHKSFDQPALIDCSFWLDSGRVLAIHGSRRSGKSLILQLLMGFELPDAGEVIAAHVLIDSETRTYLRSRNRLAMVSQSPMLALALTVGQNVRHFLNLRDDYNEQNKRDVVSGFLSMGDLSETQDLRPIDLSIGQRRMLALLKVLSASAQCILLDEPTAELEPVRAQDVYRLLLKLKKDLQMTMVVATNDLDLTRQIADKVLFLDRGRILFSGTKAEFFNSTDARVMGYVRMENE